MTITTSNNNNNNNNYILFFIIYVPSQQPKGQLQTQHSLNTGKHSLDTDKAKFTGKH
jgi:hypothetical protein